MISTRNLEGLGSASHLLRIMQSLAMLDALIEEVWEYRYFSFDSKWSEFESMGSMRNGSGDDLFAVFGANGCFLRGFDHESIMSPWGNGAGQVWPGVLSEVPTDFAASVAEPAFHMTDTTFCIWQPAGDFRWHSGNIEFPEGEDPDGSGWMLSMLDGVPSTYEQHVREYFEIEVPVEAIARVFAHAPLSADLIARFPRRNQAPQLLTEAAKIGYPC